MCGAFCTMPWAFKIYTESAQKRSMSATSLTCSSLLGWGDLLQRMHPPPHPHQRLISVSGGNGTNKQNTTPCNGMLTRKRHSSYTRGSHDWAHTRHSSSLTTVDKPDTPCFNRNVSPIWHRTQQKHTDLRQPSTGTPPDRRDRPSTSHGNDHGSSGTPPCGKSRCSHYQNDRKRTGIQTSGKSP